MLDTVLHTFVLGDQYYSTGTCTIYHEYDYMKGHIQITPDQWFQSQWSSRIGDGMVEAGKSIAQGVPWHTIWDAEKI